MKTEIYTLDTTPPTNPTSCTETHGAVDNTWQNSVSAPVFTWSGATDSGSGVSGYYWYFGTSSSGNPTTWATGQGCAPSAVSTGIYYLRVKTKDNAGNESSPVTLFTVKYDSIPPTATPSPAGGSFGSAVSVSLSCSDSDSGCDKIYYTADGSTPTTSSPVYSSPIYLMVTKTLKFFAKDHAGNSGSVQSQTYTISYNGCGNPPVKIGNTFYLTLQDAYNGASNGDTIKSRAVEFDENLTVNRNITVTLEGGYNCDYTSNTGGTTWIKGAVTTTTGGGRITVRNVNVIQ